MEFSASSQICRYSFVTLLIKNDIDHETVDSSVVISNGLSKFPCTNYNFMVRTESSSSESSKFLL